MSKVMKKLSILMLVIAMTVTMMPFAVFADDEAPASNAAITFFVNGSPTGVTISEDWMKENSESPQIFPFVSDKGKTWGYVIAQGPSFDSILSAACQNMPVTLEDIPNSQILWRKDGAAFKNGAMTVADALNAVTVFKLVDVENGNANVIGDFTGDEYKKVVAEAYRGATAPVTPIVAIQESEVYLDYEDALQALGDDSWKQNAKTDMRQYIGGNLEKDTVLKDENGVNTKSVNFTGKFSAVNHNEIDLQIPVPAEPGEPAKLTMDTGTAAMAIDEIKTELSLWELALLDGFTGLQWTTTDDKVAYYDTTGLIEAVGAGKCTITAAYADGPVLGTIEITVLENTTIKVTPTSKKFKVKDLKKKAKTFQLKATVSSGAKATFTKKSGNSKITVSKTGKVTVKKGTKKGTYPVKVKVTTPAKGDYKAGSKTVTVKVTVK